MIRPNSIEQNLRFVILAAGDFLIGIGCLALAVFIRRNFELEFTKALLPPSDFPLDFWNLSLPGLSLVIGLGLGGFYNPRVSRRHRPLLITALAIQIGLVAVGATLLTRPYPRSILFLAPLLELAVIPIWRRFVKVSLPIRARETLLVGPPRELESFLRVMQRFPDDRIRIVGLVGPAEPATGTGVPYFGDLSYPGVRDRVRLSQELMYISHEPDPDMRLDLLRVRGARGFLMIPSPSDALLTSAAFGWIGDQPLIEVAAKCSYGIWGVLKRSLDMLTGLIMLLLSLPLWPFIALAIVLDDGLPVFLKQRRAGRDGKDFMMWKFRTMRTAPESEEDLRIALDNDRRITRVGQWLRRHRLDEIPQLLNILAGEMSLVGPRPERPEVVEKICREVPTFDLRLLVRPGLAGLAQVWGEYDTSPSVKIRYDLTYICSWSIGLDFRILIRAVSTALSGRGV